jgi:serine/threonine-protein kinase RIM15
MMSPEAQDFIDKLLTVDPKKRLGANGVDEIKQHAFFKGVKWEKLKSRRPPFVPSVAGDLDLANFATDKQDFKVDGLADINEDMQNQGDQ